MSKNKFFNQGENQENQNDSTIYQTPLASNETDSHGNSKSEYVDQVVINDQGAKEVMFDRKNPFVRILLFILGMIAVLGTAYYIYIYFTTMR